MKFFFIIFTYIFASLHAATERSASPSSSPCDRIYFPNYFKWVGHDEETLKLVNQSIGSVLKQLKISHFNGDVYTNRDFFKHINDVVQEKAPGAKVYISGGVVRSILGYIYKKMYNQAKREGNIKGSKDLVLDVFNRIIGAKSRKYDPTLAELPEYDGKKDKDLIPLDALGIGSDYDILIEFPEGFTGNKQTVMEEVKNFIDQTEKNFGLRDDESYFKKAIVPVGDVKEYKVQIDRATEQGGLTLDWLAYPVTGGEIREPQFYAGKDQYPSIMQSFLQGEANYIRGRDMSAKQTIRGLRPLLEIPFLKADETSQNVMIEELNRIQSLDDASQQQLDKMTRNARFQGAHNRFGIDCNQDGALSVAVKDLAKRLGWENLISEFADKGSIKPTVQNEELERLLTPMDVFIAEYTAKDEEGNPTGILYHGTPNIDNLLSMLRSGLLISRPQEGDKKGQGRAAFGRGVYTTSNLSDAEVYAKSDGIVIPLNVNTHKPFRILDARKPDVQTWLSGHPIYNNNWEALYRNYGIDVVVVNYEQSAAPLIQNQEVVNIPKNIPFLIQSMQNALISKLKRSEPVHFYQFLKFFDPKKGYARLLKALDPTIDLDQIFIHAASGGMKSNNWNIQNSALNLFQGLAQKGQSYNEATTAATEGMKNSNTQLSAMVIFSSLVSKGFEPAYQEATTAATEGMKNSNTQLSAIRIFDALVSKRFEPAYQEATTAATEGMKNSNTQALAMVIFSSLVSNGFEPAYQEATTAATEGMKNSNTQALAMVIFSSLVSKGFEPAYQEATTAATEGMKNSNTQLSAMVIFSSLVSKGFEPAYQEATTAATEGMKNSNTQLSAIRIFDALVSKRFEPAYQEATTAATEGMKNSNTQALAMVIFSSLVSNGFEPAYQEATTAATEGMKNSNTQLSAISILSSLISKGFEPAYQQATTAATEGMKDSNT
jgi:hypothetical protein